MPGHHKYRGVDNVHTTFGRTNGVILAPSQQEGANRDEKSSRIPVGHVNTTTHNMNRYEANHAHQDKAERRPGKIPGAGHLRADYCTAAHQTFRTSG